jgi:ATP-dependent RNA helicase DeaD
MTLMQRTSPAGGNVFAPDANFSALGLSGPLLRAIEAMGFERPTHVQAQLIPVALEGRDILGQSRTGTGKTAAFGLPMLERLLRAEGTGRGGPHGMVLVPTRELAVQVAHEMRNLSRFTELKVVPIYGGQRIKAQASKLERGADVVVGTPGRVMDLHQRGLLSYDRIAVAVLDEVDRMLDIGFRDDIRRILGGLRQAHQTVFVSATISPEIERLARQYLRDPQKLVLTGGSLTVSEVEQHYVTVEPWDKNRMLVHILEREQPELTLIFCRTKQRVDGLAEYLRRKSVDAHAIHGDMYQSKRNQVMEKLRSGQLGVLVASDLAARGLDVDDISHVINYDLPDDIEMYVHRIGRTARAGRRGVAWSLVTPDQGSQLTAIERLAGAEIKERRYEDFEPGPVPAAVTEERAREKARREAQRDAGSRLVSAPPSGTDASDATRFPGGLVPSDLPARRMGGRLKSRRR